MSNNSVRWAFNFTKWNPSHSDMLLAFSCVQQEEKERLARFVFKKDIKSSLAGRLLMRKFVHERCDKKYNEVRFIRDYRGRPVLEYPEMNPNLQFNVSHQGEYTVLAGEGGDTLLGIDVMKLEYTGGKSVTNFFSLMTRHFSPLEWDTIKEPMTEKEQVDMFCRLWCLKESYTKALGVGIRFDSLQNISFKINSKQLHKDRVVTDTELFVKGEKLDWIFEEMLLDDDHCVAVSLSKENISSGMTFDKIDFNSLMANCVPLLSNDELYCENYFKKSEKP